MALGLILGIGRAFRKKRASALDILTSKRGPRGYYKGKGCKPTGFHTRKGTILKNYWLRAFYLRLKVLGFWIFITWVDANMLCAFAITNLCFCKLCENGGGYCFWVGEVPSYTANPLFGDFNCVLFERITVSVSNCTEWEHFLWYSMIRDCLFWISIWCNTSFKYCGQLKIWGTNWWWSFDALIVCFDYQMLWA